MVQHKIQTDHLNGNISVERVGTQQSKVQEHNAVPVDVTYRPVPQILDLPGEVRIPHRWRIQFISENREIMGLDIYDDVMLGRGRLVLDRMGIDFTEWLAQEKGVSREHALLRPTPTCLYLVDIGSTNGTLHNAEVIPPGVAPELADDDIIVLGRLVLKLRIVRSPQDELPLFALDYDMPKVATADPLRVF